MAGSFYFYPRHHMIQKYFVFRFLPDNHLSDMGDTSVDNHRNLVNHKIIRPLKRIYYSNIKVFKGL